MRERFLTVVEVGQKLVDKNKVPYRVVRFQEKQVLGARELTTRGVCTRNLRPATYEQLVNGVAQQFRGDVDFETIMIGDSFAGHKAVLSTTDYRISENGPLINTWTGAIFDGENELEIADRNLSQYGAHPLYLNEETQRMIPYASKRNQRPAATAAGSLVKEMVGDNQSAEEDPQ